MSQEITEIPLYSSSAERLSTLAAQISPKDSERFLFELLNFRMEDSERFFRRSKNFLPPIPAKPEDWTEEEWEKQGFERGMKQDVCDKQLELRRAWRGPTTLYREIEMMAIIAQYWQKERIETDAPDPFFVCLYRALKLADRMRYCQNPGCPAPYFIAQRRSQRYCSGVCAQPAQREFKRRWWGEHGEDWRKARKASEKKSQRKRGK